MILTKKILKNMFQDVNKPYQISSSDKKKLIAMPKLKRLKIKYILLV